METPNVFNPISSTYSQFPPIFFFRFPLFSRKNEKFNFPSRTNSAFIPKPARFSVATASTSCESVAYGGWDDDLIGSGESTLLRDFFVSTGIGDSRHLFAFLLGIICAFYISRVRVSTIVVFPASVLIFAVGFSFGFFRGGSFGGLNLNSSKRKGKDENFRVDVDKLRGLVDFFDGFDVKVNNLKSDIQRAIDTKEIELVDLEGYVSLIESIQSSALNSRNVLEATVDGVGNSGNVDAENQKSSGRKKKENGEVGFEFMHFVGGLFGEKLIDSKPNKVKDKSNVKNEHIKGKNKDLANDQTNEIRDGSSNDMDDGILNYVDSNKRKQPSKFSQGLRSNSGLNWDSERRIRIIAEDARMRSRTISRNREGYDGGEYSYQSSRLQFLDNQQISWKSSQINETDPWETRENLQDSFSFERTKTEASFVREEKLNQSGEVYRSSRGRNIYEDETYRSQVQAESFNDSTMENDVLSDDLMFDRYLKESNDLLKRAKECIRRKQDVEYAEIILYKSAKLLSKAVAMKPMSLLAVGLLGNTYLLHGELKLKITRELRTRLFSRDRVADENRGRRFQNIDKEVIDKDKIASALVDACEECEELLVEAGRKYRLALSIDGNDVRALYNWGLALSFRAQLIADIGPEAAFDADKVFLAAIDKFDAMMSKGNQYAPDALFRWGVILQQRSQLRPRNSREKVKLLLQAKRLYEDALDMDSGNPQVREALLSCIGEINHRLL